MNTDAPKPLISVVIPTFNRRHVIGRAVSSVLDQAMKDFELIVVDDGSSDDTETFLAAFGDPRLKVVSQENAGVCAARNAGVAASSADYVTFLDSDDEVLPGWLAYFARSIRDGFDLASCGINFSGPGPKNKLVLPESSGREFGYLRARFLSGAFGIKKDLFLAAGGFRAGLRHSEHTDLALRLGGLRLHKSFTFTAVNDIYVTMHRDERPYDAALQFETAMTLLREDDQHLRRNRQMHATYFAIAGVAAGHLGRTAEARRLLLRAVAMNPLAPVHYARLVRQVMSGLTPKSSVAASGL